MSKPINSSPYLDKASEVGAGTLCQFNRIGPEMMAEELVNENAAQELRVFPDDLWD